MFTPNEQTLSHQFFKFQTLTYQHELAESKTLHIVFLVITKYQLVSTVGQITFKMQYITYTLLPPFFSITIFYRVINYLLHYFLLPFNTMPKLL